MNFVLRYSSLISYINNGHERSVKAKKNILGLGIFRFINVLISLMVIPITINYVSAQSYGIWLTLSSIISWMSFFDIGINNGLRNKLAESLALSKIEESQKLVSTTYAILSLIFIPLLIILIIANQFINWGSILNVSRSISSEIHLVTSIFLIYFCLRFILSTIEIILLAHQRPAEASLRNLMEQMSSLIVIYILTKTTTGSLLNLSFGLCLAPLVVLMFFNILLFKKRYRYIAPKFSKIDFSLGKGLFSLGIKYFVIQIAGIIQYQTTNFLIAHFFGSYEVTAYNIAFKYFSVLNMVFSIFLLPFWSAVTEAYTKNDLNWIKNAVYKYIKTGLVFLIIGVVMLLISNIAYDLWLGKGKIVVPFPVSVWSFIFVITAIFSGIFVSVINGLGMMRIQFYMCLITPVLFIGLSYFFVKYCSLGVESIIISSVVANVSGFVIAPMQYRKIISGKKGIWVK